MSGGLASLGISTEEAAINMKAALGGCCHRQAEPVDLCTGETVACICIACLAKLPTNWITRQRDHAEVVAFCRHEDMIEITNWGAPGSDTMCASCGTRGTKRH